MEKKLPRCAKIISRKLGRCDFVGRHKTDGKWYCGLHDPSVQGRLKMEMQEEKEDKLKLAHYPKLLGAAKILARMVNKRVRVCDLTSDEALAVHAIEQIAEEA